MSFWILNTNYKNDDLVTYKDIIYKCIQSHTAFQGWTPDVTPTLWSYTKNNYTSSKKAIYYHTNWSCYARNFQIKDIPLEVKDISYAFWNVNADGSVVTGDAWADTDKRYVGNEGVQPPDTWNDNNGIYGNFGQIKKIQDSGRELNVSLSIGGWTWSKYFSQAVSTNILRSKLSNSLIEIFKKYPIFSGISIDWEYVSNDGINYGNEGNISTPQDCENFILFLQHLRNALNANDFSKYKIAMCTTAATDKCKFDVEQVHPLIDQLHVMTYDFHDGSWGETTTGFSTNPRKSSISKFSCEEAADYYLSRGVPSTKIFIGAAFYSRGFNNTDGPGLPASGGSPDMTWEKGSVDYKLLPLLGAKEYNDPESKAAYSYDPIKRIVNTYDNKISIIEKCKIIYEKNLGGCIIWENSSDNLFNDPRSLTKTFYDNLTNGSPQPTQNPTPNPTPVPQPKPIPKPIPNPNPTPNPTPPNPKFNVSFTIDSNGLVSNMKSMRL